jgi:hypothetical protein
MYHSPVCKLKTQTTQKVRLDLNSRSQFVIRDAFTIDSSTPDVKNKTTLATRHFICIIYPALVSTLHILVRYMFYVFFLAQTENLYNFTFLNPLLLSTFTMFMLFLFVCFYIFYNSPVNTEITIDTQNLYLYCCCFCYCYLLNSTMIFDLF